MTKRTIWIINFSTTILMLLVFLIFAFHRIFAESNDKDAIVIIVTVAIMLYMGLVAFLFYDKFIKRDAGRSQAFYLTIFPFTGLCVFMLVNVGRSTVADGANLDIETVVVSIICGLNILTFCFGLTTKRE